MLQLEVLQPKNCQLQSMARNPNQLHMMQLIFQQQHYPIPQ
jgi:predicted NACHT family NTPase